MLSFKTLKGLLKLLYPEVYIENNNDLSKEILGFLLVIAIIARQTVNNQIAIIEKRELGNIKTYPSNIKNVYFNLEVGMYILPIEYL